MEYKGFYLAGGTGLALQLGHRDSIDFDFFIQGDFNTNKLIELLEIKFLAPHIKIIQQENNTVSCIIDDTIRLSFFGYRNALIKPLISSECMNIASIEDIGCMKLAAILSRSLEKDYVDLYFILHRISLSDLLTLCGIKYPTLDTSVILKSLIYFNDIAKEPIFFKENHSVTLIEIQKFLQRVTRDYLS